MECLKNSCFQMRANFNHFFSVRGLLLEWKIASEATDGATLQRCRFVWFYNVLVFSLSCDVKTSLLLFSFTQTSGGTEFLEQLRRSAV